MHHRPAHPQPDELQHQTEQPEARHRQQERAPQPGAPQFLRQQQTGQPDRDADIDQAAIGDLQDRAVGQRGRLQRCRPVEQCPEQQVEGREAEAVQRAQLQQQLRAHRRGRIPSGCVVSAAPEEARVEPISFGPLTLVGLSVAPETLTDRAMLWIDTYWTIEAPIKDDLWIAVAGQPLLPKAPVWQGDHEPCDWMWPTSRWTRGTIYRDRYGLRPPRRMVKSEMDVWLGLRRSGEAVGVDRAVARVSVVSTQPPRPAGDRDRRRRRGN